MPSCAVWILPACDWHPVTEHSFEPQPGVTASPSVRATWGRQEHPVFILPQANGIRISGRDLCISSSNKCRKTQRHKTKGKRQHDHRFQMI